MDPSFARDHLIPIIPLSHPIQALYVDGQPFLTGPITHRTASLPASISGTRWEPTTWFFVTPLFSRDILIGHPWLVKHNPSIDWSNGFLTSRTPPPPPSHARAHTPTPTPTPPPLPSHIPQCYADFADVFDVEAAERLPPSRGIHDFAIDIKPGLSFPKSHKVYPQTAAGDKLIEEMALKGLKNGTMRRAKADDANAIFVAFEEGRRPRICMDLRAKNAVLEADAYPLPNLHEMVQAMAGGALYTKIDMKSAYHQIRIRDSDVHKTAFKCKLGTFETLVMYEGWATAPSHFQRFVDDITTALEDLHSYLDDNAIVTMPGGNVEEDHIRAVRAFLEVCRKHRYYANPAKSAFHKTEIEFGGYLVGSKGIKISPDSLVEINELPRPTSVSTTQSVIGLLLYFSDWIPHWGEAIRPLQEVAKPNSTFSWGPRQEAAFEYLKSCCASATTLRPYNRTLPAYVYTDASSYAMGAVLLQRDDATQKLRPVQFMGRKFKPAERNYTINDKELLAIVDMFRRWRNWLSGTIEPVTVCTDHRNLTYFMGRHRLTPRHARWAVDLAEYNFKIQHVPHTQNLGADALSRNPAHEPTAAEKASDREQVLLPTDVFLPRPTYPIANIAALTLPDTVTTSTEWVTTEARKLELCRLFHDHATAGHPGWERTDSKIHGAGYDWKGRRQYVHNYVRSCDSCQRNKPDRSKPYGTLQPLPIPEDRWTHVSLDFVTGLPESTHLGQTYNAVLTVVDRRTKMGHFIACRDTVTAEESVALYIAHVFRHHGLPLDIVSDRGPQFVSAFWNTFWRSLGVNPSLTTAYHPQSDGGTERLNQTWETYLRHYVNYDQSDWAPMLPLAEFAYNNAVHDTTGTTPFYANTLRHPLATPAQRLPISTTSASAEDQVATLENQLARMAVHMTAAQEYWKKRTNAHRQEAPFKVGDLVWLLRRNLQTTRPARKLDYRKVGPYKISSQINPVAFKLDLPPDMHIHNVFHASLLSPHHANTIPDRVIAPPPPVEFTGQAEVEFVVKEILNVRKKGRGWQWLVDWEGYGIGDRTWEPWRNLERSKESVVDYHRAHPTKPCPIHIRNALTAKRGGIERDHTVTG